MVVFRSLEKEDLLQISKIALENLKKRAMSLGIELSYSPKVIEAVAKVKETEKYGARPIKRRVTELIENKLAQMIVSSDICKGEKIRVDMTDDQISIVKSVVV